jgi:hypothetical protein
MPTVSSDFSIRLDQSSRCETPAMRPASLLTYPLHSSTHPARQSSPKKQTPLKLGLVLADSYDYDLAFCIRVISPAPRAMSRQAGPSIVLSVLIVCFFAVALFQRDLPRAGAKGRRSQPRESVARTSPPAPGRTPGGLARDEASESRATVSTKTSSTTGESSAYKRVDRAASAAPAADRAPNNGRQRRSVPSVAHGLNRPGERAQQTSARATGQTPPPVSAGPQRKTVSARSGRSAFTTALESETIEDVSSRVYGTPEHGDLLWRANRDTLPQRNSPLSTGMLLRTPSIR